MRPRVLFTLALTVITIVALPLGTEAATCSCAGVSLTGALRQSGLEDNAVELNFTYGFHDISDLVAGGEEVEDATGRKRETRTYLMQLSYGLTDEWTFSTLLPYVEHTRNISTSNTRDEVSGGMGDAVLAAIYTPKKITVYSRNEVAFGIAQKFSNGVDDNAQGNIRFIEDMQPGTGAEATTAWLYYARSFSQQANSIVYSSLSYTTNGTNDLSYRFGDEVNLSLGYRFQSESPWAYDASLNFRDARAHERFGGEVPNTGGEWLDLTPTVQYSFTERLAGRLSARLPLDRDLNGALQFTTKYAINASLTYQWR